MKLRLSLLLLALALGAPGSPALAAIGPVAVLGAMPPAAPSTTTDQAVNALKANHINAKVVSPQQLADPAQFNAGRYDLLVLPDSAVFPAVAQANLLNFLKQRGKLIAIGGPAFSQYVYERRGAWLSREDVLRSLPSGTPILDLSHADLARWAKSADSSASTISADVEPTPHGPALHLKVPDYKNWTNVTPPPLETSPFQTAGDNLTTFWAKGDAKTTGLVLDWRETDGSRWIAGVPITTTWRRYVLTPQDFRFWRDGSPADRGGPGDTFHPERAHSISIGMAQSHAPMPPGPKEAWIADLTTAKMPQGMPSVEPPVLESISPWYKVYVHNGMVHPIVRYLGEGLTGPRPGVLTILPLGGLPPAVKFNPVTQAWGAGGPQVWTWLAMEDPFKGAAWSGMSRFSPNDLASLVKSMRNGIYLTAYGSSEFSAQPGETIPLGADITNTGGVYANVRVHLSISGPGAAAEKYTQALMVPAGGAAPYRVNWRARTPGMYDVEVSLLQNGRKIADRRQPLRVLEIPHHPASDMVKVVGGEFMLHGKPWRANGINFWPLYVSGQDPDAYQSGWLSPNQYDPVLCEADLTLCQQLHINEVSIQYTRPEWAPALLDFLARCRAHGILANIYLPGGNALDQNLAQTTSVLKAANLAGNDAVFAYDIAWEPRAGNHAQRRRLDPDWRQWILDQYGSVDAARTDWGFDPPLENGEVTNPLDSQLTADGPWRRMVAAYRRFMDDRINDGYRRTADAIHAIDPNHLLGVRSGYGGTGSLWAVSGMAYDLVSGAKHLDFISPEGYALSGPWPEFRKGGFTTAYARWAGNGKPVFWAEFGQSVYPHTTPERIQEQADYYDMMYRMVIDSGANGSAGWWFPGGLRVNENSDFGIIAPGGAVRGSALALQHYAPQITAMTIPKTGYSYITFDRDADPRGYAEVWIKGGDQYVALREKGKPVALRTEGTGTNTATVPLVAVGDVPANGHDPLKYVNAEIDRPQVLTQNGRLTYEVRVGNTGEAEWLAHGPGRVVLMMTSGGNGPKVVVPLPKNVARYQDAVIGPFMAGAPETFRLAILGRPLAPGQPPAPIPFGETVHWGEAK